MPNVATGYRSRAAAERLLEAEMTGPELIHQLENATASAGDAGEGIVCDDDRQTGLLREQFVDVAQQRAATRKHDATLGDVGSELRRSLLERGLDRAHDTLQRLLQRLEDLVAVQRETARHAFRKIAAFHREL